MSCIVNLFTPWGGTIFDLYTDMMSVSLAAVRNGRKCVSIERDTLYFNTAVQPVSKSCRYTEGSVRNDTWKNGFNKEEIVRRLSERDDTPSESIEVFESLTEPHISNRELRSIRNANRSKVRKQR